MTPFGVHTDDTRRLVARMWVEGHSTGSIATAAGLSSRNAVCGLIWRMRQAGWPVPPRLPVDPPTPDAAAMRRGAKKQADLKEQRRPRPSTPRPPRPVVIAPPVVVQEPVAPVLVEPAAPVSLLDRTHFQCSWVLPDRDPYGLAMCCGAPVAGREPWCAEHRRVVYVAGSGYVAGAKKSSKPTDLMVA